MSFIIFRYQDFQGTELLFLDRIGLLPFGFFGHGQADAEGRPASFLTFHLYVPVVSVNDALHHRQAQPGAGFLLGGVKGVQAMLPLFFRHPDSRVTDLQDDLLFFLSGAQ